MDEFVHRVEQRLTGEGVRLSVVSNPDGFLKQPDVQQAILKACGLLLLPIVSSLELRVRYELTDRSTSERICYIMDDTDCILPDIRKNLYDAHTFNLADILPAYDGTELSLAKPNFAMASYIYQKKKMYNLSAKETREVVEDAVRLYGLTETELIAELDKIPLAWDNVETMDAICQVLLKAISQDRYDKMEDKIASLNENFQQYIDTKYFGLATSSHILKPKMVNKILPHLAYKHGHMDKVALVVIDGMSYWQYLVLDRRLEQLGVQTHKDISLAWLPSITRLSRQAIFRGDMPTVNYSQNPMAEKKLWNEFWTEKCNASKRMNSYEIDYTYGSLFAGDYNLYKQAFVDVSLDEKMHSSSNNKDLYSLTENWAKETAEGIKALHDEKYTVYITTDHGNIMAHHWRALSSIERTFLYEKESRGSRHLMYAKHEYLEDFLQNNKYINNELLVHDNWAIWRNTNCFKGQDEITHGGSHFLEVVIPFITINHN
jgi:hypothetical protein